MLDDLKVIHERDPEDSLGTVERQWQQLTHDFKVDLKTEDIANVVHSGMGGSSFPALFAATWPGCKVPFMLNRDYNIPDFVSDKTLFIACSYSGNTEETISSLEAAEKRHAQICVVANGGKLEEIAKERGYPFISLPSTGQPRYAKLYIFKALVSILENTRLSADSEISPTTEAASKFLEDVSKRWQAVIPTSKNVAKQIAIEAAGKSVVIYGGPLMMPAANTWKIGFNENAKQVAWWNVYPEFNHNEFIGWSEQPVLKPYLVVDLRSNLEHPRIQKRFELSSKLLSGKRPDPVVVNAEGNSVLEQLLFCSMLGDFASIYTAIASGINPAPVALVEKLKKELG